MKRFLLIYFPLLLASLSSGETQLPEFSAYSAIGKHDLFALTNLQTRESSGWIPIGGTFQEFTIAAFDTESDTLVLRHGTLTSRVPLKAPRVVALKPKSHPRTTSSHVEGGLELRMTIAQDGVLSLNGHAFPGETLDALFTVMAQEREALLLIIERSFPKETFARDEALLKKLMAQMREAGLKRGAIRIIAARGETLAK